MKTIAQDRQIAFDHVFDDIHYNDKIDDRVIALMEAVRELESKQNEIVKWINKHENSI